MHLSEIYQPTPAGFRSEKEDHSVYNKHDQRARSTRLTLDKLNRLRMMNDARRLEHEKKLDSVSNQYRAPEAAGGALPL